MQNKNLKMKCNYLDIKSTEVQTFQNVKFCKKLFYTEGGGVSEQWMNESPSRRQSASEVKWKVNIQQIKNKKKRKLQEAEKYIQLCKPWP